MHARTDLVKMAVHCLKIVNTAMENVHVIVDNRMKVRVLFIKMFDDTVPPHTHTFGQEFGDVGSPWKVEGGEPACNFLNTGKCVGLGWQVGIRRRICPVTGHACLSTLWCDSVIPLLSAMVSWGNSFTVVALDGCMTTFMDF